MRFMATLLRRWLLRMERNSDRVVENYDLSSTSISPPPSRNFSLISAIPRSSYAFA